MEIKIISNNEKICPAWDQFVATHANGCLYHSLEWRDVIHKSYGHITYYLAAFINSKHAIESPVFLKKPLILGESDNRLIGFLGLVHIKGWLFGNSAISIPFVDAGGLLAKDELAEELILLSAIKIAEKIKVNRIDLRQNYQFIKFNCDDYIGKINLLGWKLSLITNKVRMILDLPQSSDLLMRSLGAKLRNQIRKPTKEGLVVKIGGMDFVNDFYDVFSENMRDLGSPVHSKRFILETLKAFHNTANVFMVYSNQTPLAGSITIGFRDILYNPWASSLRRYSSLAPNMLLYWSMLAFACQNGYKRFDFGRSTPGEGTYKFKEQWGAKPEPLYWYRFSKTNGQDCGDGQLDKDKMNKAIEYWKRLPVSVTKIIGPRIRKYISL